jgi:hypothetical protein
VGLLTKAAPKAQSLCFATPGNDKVLITLKPQVAGHNLRALVDCGASNNFVRRQPLEDLALKYVEREIPPARMTVRLATGASVKGMKRVVGLHYKLDGNEYGDDFIVLELDDKFDVISGLPWLRRYDPWISWRHRSVKMPAALTSKDHLMSALSRPHARRFVESESDGLTRHTVVSTTAQGCDKHLRFIVEPAAGGCAETQAAPKTSHENKFHESSGTCAPSGPCCVETSRENKSHELSERRLPRGQHHDKWKSASAAGR